MAQAPHARTSTQDPDDCNQNTNFMVQLYHVFVSHTAVNRTVRTALLRVPSQHRRSGQARQTPVADSPSLRRLLPCRRLYQLPRLCSPPRQAPSRGLARVSHVRLVECCKVRCVVESDPGFAAVPAHPVVTGLDVASVQRGLRQSRAAAQPPPQQLNRHTRTGGTAAAFSPVTLGTCAVPLAPLCGKRHKIGMRQ